MYIRFRNFGIIQFGVRCINIHNKLWNPAELATCIENLEGDVTVIGPDLMENTFLQNRSENFHRSWTNQHEIRKTQPRTLEKLIDLFQTMQVCLSCMNDDNWSFISKELTNVHVKNENVLSQTKLNLNNYFHHRLAWHWYVRICSAYFFLLTWFIVINVNKII